MRSLKIGACLAAAAVVGITSAALAAPSNTVSMKPCGQLNVAYAQGYADGACKANGSTGGGTLTSCTDNGDGTLTISYTCY